MCLTADWILAANGADLWPSEFCIDIVGAGGEQETVEEKMVEPNDTFPSDVSAGNAFQRFETHSEVHLARCVLELWLTFFDFHGNKEFTPEGKAFSDPPE